ncbi:MULTISPECIES: AMP-binding protein [Streptomyces]|uniref:AMP-binding protein n=1 Tax=Streptomyces TaxID=1883 RepID=UPI002258D15E|nr:MULTISPECIES: AMP-binding protein [Streptomyces]MCX4432077.1 AMP-binding protein [Streptomyces mirabilis]MCX5182838.1 AMP-binding protein [Streptomyces sp. NBC_00268]
MAEGFVRQVRLTPTAPALAAGDRTLSYAELDAHAAALAAELLEHWPLLSDDEQPRSIALHLEPSVEHVVALLALARLNITIVPLDPGYPPALLRQILDQAEPLCVLGGWRVVKCGCCWCAGYRRLAVRSRSSSH